MIKLDEKKEIAKKCVNAINKMPEFELYILLRSNGKWGGVVYKTERKSYDGKYRVAIHYIRPDGSDGVEYLDYMPDPSGEPEDCRPILFDEPFILTCRTRPGFDDEDSSFQWIVIGDKAEWLVRLRDDVIRKQEEVNELAWQLDQYQAVITRQQNEIKILSERVRHLEDDISSISAENVRLKEVTSNLQVLIKEYMAMGHIAMSAADELLRIADKAGLHWVMGARDKLPEILDEHKRFMETMYSIFGGEEISSQLGMIASRINDFNQRLEDFKKEIDDLKKEGLKKGEVETREVKGKVIESSYER